MTPGNKHNDRLERGDRSDCHVLRASDQAGSAANGVGYAYRHTGEGAIPLVLLQHFRGDLDHWDPALVDALASTRSVVTFDNAGVGGSTGTTPDTIEQMAHDAIVFVTAMGFAQVDILGVSMRSFIAQEITLARPALVRKLILASSAPQGGAGMHGWAPDVIGAMGGPEISPEQYLDGAGQVESRFGARPADGAYIVGVTVNSPAWPPRHNGQSSGPTGGPEDGITADKTMSRGHRPR